MKIIDKFEEGEVSLYQCGLVIKACHASILKLTLKKLSGTTLKTLDLCVYITIYSCALSFTGDINP